MAAGAAVTLDRFEARTYEALAGVTRDRRALLGHSVLFAVGAFSTLLLKRCEALVSNEWLASLRIDEAETAARVLGTLHARLSQVLELAEAKGLTHHWLHRRGFQVYRAVNDRVADVLESLHLALNEDFRPLIGVCAEELKDRPGRRNWRSSLAALRD